MIFMFDVESAKDHYRVVTYRNGRKFAWTHWTPDLSEAMSDCRRKASATPGGPHRFGPNFYQAQRTLKV